MGRAYDMHAQKMNAYTRVLVGVPKEERPLGRLRHRLENNIKTDHREIGWDGMEWINVAQNRD
jgi:hypothetical protein